MHKLRIGETVFYQGKEYVIEGIDGLKRLICKDEIGNLKIIDISEIDEESSNNVSFSPEESIDKFLYETAKKRLKIIKPLLNNRSKKEVIKRAEEFGYSVPTLYNWIKTYIESNNNILSLVPKFDKRGGKGKSRIDKKRLKIINQIIAERYLSMQRPNIAQITREINAIFHDQGLETVSFNTIKNIVKQIDERYVYRKREGRSKYLNNLKPSPNEFSPSYPLEVVQIDHTPLDIQIVDETYRKPIGRPYITVAMDVYSRMIYGFYVTLDAPSLYSVGQTLYMGLFPKEEYLAKIGVEGEWNIFGIPDTIHVDNAKEFRSRGLQTFCETIGINLEFRPRGQPFFGGHIERVIKTINLQIHTLKGTTFSNPKERGEYQSEKQATFTLKELERYIVEWIVNIYHKTPHNGLDGITPEQKFKEGLSSKNGLPVEIKILNGESEKRFAKIALLPFEERKITKQGVSLFKLKFFDESLIPFITPDNNVKHVFRYDPKDLNQIYFYHPDLKEYIEIPNIKKLYPPPTKWELEAVSKETKKLRQREVNSEKIYESILKLRKMEEEASQKTKQARRRKENRNVQTPLSQKDKQSKNEKTANKPKPKITKFEIDFED